MLLENKYRRSFLELSRKKATKATISSDHKIAIDQKGLSQILCQFTISVIYVDLLFNVCILSFNAPRKIYKING